MDPNWMTGKSREALPQVDKEHLLLALAEEVRGGRDETQPAEQGKLDPVIGRDEEIRRVIQVLSRRTKNNPVLKDQPGSHIRGHRA
jgi:ATP-dependent Clp protease ATP-binding subunit ClpA